LPFSIVFHFLLADAAMAAVSMPPFSRRLLLIQRHVYYAAYFLMPLDD